MEYDSIIKSNEVLCYNMGKMKYSALVLVIFLWLLSEEVCFFLCTLERATLVTRGEECTCQCRRHGFNPWSRKIPHAKEAWRQRTTTIEPGSHDYWSPHTLEPELHSSVDVPQWEAQAPQLESGPHSPQLEKSLHSNEDPAQPKISKFF